MPDILLQRLTQAALGARSSRRVLARQFLIFAAVGAVGTGVQYVVLIALVAAGTNPVAASTVGFLISAVANYLVNYRLTFRSTLPHSSVAPRFAVIAASALLLNALLMWIQIHRFGLQYLVAQVVTTGLVLIWNFIFSRLWTFKPR
jgi:putative flippase GtrA